MKHILTVIIRKCDVYWYFSIDHSYSKTLLFLSVFVTHRLAYLLIIDVSSFRPSWQRLLLNRIVGKLSADYKDRIVFQTPESPAHAVHIMQMGHVLLDPFPVTGKTF